MALVACPGCKARTPSSSVRCVHCGGLPPTCAECKGTGACPACPTAAPAVTSNPFGAFDSFGASGTPACPRCAGTAACATCGGAKRHWPAA